MQIAFSRNALVATLVLLLTLTDYATAAQPWEEAPKFKCDEVISGDGSLTSRTGAMLTWLAGYRDGVGSLASLDGRLKSVGGISLSELGPMVLAYCKAKPMMPVAEAATGVFEFMINGQPGPRIDLAVPHSH